MNKFTVLLAAGAAALCPLAAPAAAAPTSTLQTAPQQVATIPFDPPLGEPLRYRFETVVEQDGGTQSRWAVSTIRFEAAENGYRMHVTPLSHGTDETAPLMVALYERLAELMAKPYAVRLAADGTILALEEEETYWDASFEALEALLTDTSVEPAVTAAIGGVLKLYREMPGPARTALLTQDLQPLVEFGETETVTGEPLSGTIPGESPLGGELNREFHISLDRVTGDVAHLSTWITIPRAEIEALSAGMVARVASLQEEEAAQFRAGIAALENFTHETRATYQVSTLTGLTLAFRSTETIEAGDGEQTRRKRTVRTVQALD